MKKFYFSLILGLLLGLNLQTFNCAALVKKTNEPKPQAVVTNKIPIQAVIKAKDYVEKEKSIIFDGSASFLGEAKKNIEYVWNFGDGNSDRGVEVVHTYDKPGEYEVILLLKAEGSESQIKQKIFVYNRLMLLITDNSFEKETIQSLVEYAKKNGVLLKIIESFDAASEIASENILLQKIAQAKEELKETEQLIIWTKSSSGIHIIGRLPVELEESKIDYLKKDIFFITEERINTIVKIARGLFNTIKPNKIVITRKEGLYLLMEESKADVFLKRASERGIALTSLDKNTVENLKFYNFLSYLINYLVEKNVPINTISLVLLLPLIVTVIAFFKQIVGLSTLGVYTPSIITLSFLALGLKFGLIFLFINLIVGLFAYFILKKFSLLYIPKMAILLIIISLSIIAILAIGAYFNFSAIVSIAIFPLLILSTLVEKFVSMQGNLGLKSALFAFIETIFVSIIAYILIGGEVDLPYMSIKWEFLKTLILGYPEMIFIFIVINVFLGHYTGLRLSEYVRFKEIIRRQEEEE